MTIQLHMDHKDYTTSFVVDKSPEDVFKAVNNVRGWWSGEIEGDTDRLGAKWTYRYKDMHRSTQKITKLIPDKRVVWHVTDSYLSFVDDKSEWNGTDIIFEIREKGGKTELVFTHRGLAPQSACYDDCSRAWGFYIDESLKSLIETGKGDPNKEES